MEYAAWAPRYAAIRAEFGFRMEAELRARDLLLSLLPVEARTPPLPRIAPRIHGRDVVVVGGAPEVGPPPIWRTAERPALVAADPATAVCLDAGLVPDVVVTDLDGPVPAEVSANARGALVVVHAHGDNLPALAQWVPEFSGELAGSWAGPPSAALLDVGGFTDGDRAVFLAHHLNARRILLWGFAFDRPAETEPGEGARKRAKLAWAERLIGELAHAGPVPIETWHPDGRRTPYRVAPTGPSTQ
jgi:2-amino-4-hydroxy-6-hydroxymethyldihydropteridine diphosphokinase